MKTSKVLFDFPQFNWSNLVHFAMYVSIMFFNCPLFTVHPFTKEEFDTAILDLQSKGVNAYDPKLGYIANRNEAWKVLMKMMRQIASSVEMVSGGDAAIIVLSGFKAKSFTNHNPKSKLKVKHGKLSGQVEAKWGKDPKAFSYVLRYSINEEGLRDVYTEVNVGKTKVTINNLLRGREYMFSLAIVDENGKETFGNPVFLMVI